ncbi:MAG: hypothetical protein JXK16_12790 [Thiotrichales bacterium]|nr:hypothetical protein [Thiotrichales bacterium]
MATELLLNNPIGNLLYGDINTFDSRDETTRIDTALFGSANLLSNLAGFGYDNATPGDRSNNVLDAFSLIREIPLFGTALYLNNQLVPSQEVLLKLQGLLNGLPLVGSTVLPMLAPERTQDEFGGDALGAVVGQLKSFPTLEGPVSFVIENLHKDPLLGDQVQTLTTFLHDFSFAGNLIAGTVPAGSALSSNDGTGHDTLDLIVEFAASTPVVGSVVDTVIPNVFPKALGGDVIALAGVLHDVIPGYVVVDALIGENGFVSGLLQGQVNTDALLGLTDVLVDAAPELGGLLGGTGLLSGNGGGDLLAGASGLLGILNLGSGTDSALGLGGLNNLLSIA